MYAMLQCLFSQESLESGTLIAFSNSVNTTLEACDFEHLKNELFAVTEVIYNKIVETANSADMLAMLNIEQQEFFLNNLCSSL